MRVTQSRPKSQLKSYETSIFIEMKINIFPLRLLLENGSGTCFESHFSDGWTVLWTDDTSEKCDANAHNVDTSNETAFKIAYTWLWKETHDHEGHYILPAQRLYVLVNMRIPQKHRFSMFYPDKCDMLQVSVQAMFT